MLLLAVGNKERNLYASRSLTQRSGDTWKADLSGLYGKGAHYTRRRAPRLLLITARADSYRL